LGADCSTSIWSFNHFRSILILFTVFIFLGLNKHSNINDEKNNLFSCDDISNFARQYYAQHTSTVFNDRIYFCLEERSLLCSLVFNANFGIGFKNSSNSESFDDGENVLSLLFALQVLFYI
jgi:hypothetical protein